MSFGATTQDSSVVYIRFYQKLVTTPILRDLFNLASMPLNLIIAHQDRRVVVTQQPKASSFRGGEKLVQGDRPIVEYRRRRHELKQQAGATD